MFTELTSGLSGFEAATEGKSILLRFHAAWCGPCKAVEPTLLALQKETGVEVLSIDIDNNDAVSVKMGIHSVPTVIALKDGNPVGIVVGAQKKQAFMELIEKMALPPIQKLE